ncbi:MAG: WYL domain-containing protein [Victivallaceae bacterium]|nr:WYL domain-containing protein [Victivallaceae bacterium]
MKQLRFSECRIKGDDFPALPFGVGATAYSAVCRAISGGFPLEIDYRDYHGNATTRIVHPVALASYGGKWYLVAFCELRQNARTFSLRNIRSACCVETSPGVAPEKFNCGLTLPKEKGRFFGVFVPSDVYVRLERLFRNAAPEVYDDWFSRYRAAYGADAAEKLKNHLFFHIVLEDWQWEVRDRLLQFLPPLLTEKERFEIFETIIAGCEARRILDRHVHYTEWPVGQWFAVREDEFRKSVYDAVVAAYCDLDFSRRYDLGKICWLSGRDVGIFRRVLEKVREKEAADKFRRLDGDLALFDARAQQMRTFSSGVTAEIKFTYEIPGHRFEVVLYDPEARKRKEIKEKFNRFSCCTLFVLFVVVFLFIIGGLVK